MTNQSKLLIYPLDRSAFIQLRKLELDCELKKVTPLQEEVVSASESIGNKRTVCLAGI